MSIRMAGMCTVWGAAVLIGAVHYGRAGAPVDRQQVFKDATSGKAGATIDLRAYIAMSTGNVKHRPAVLRILEQRFKLQDTNKDNRLTLDEFLSPGGNPEAALSGGGQLLHPTHDLVVGVEPYNDDFEAFVLVGDDENTEYAYFGKIYSDSGLPSTIPADPTTVGAIEFDAPYGLYSSKYFTETDHQETKTGLVATPKHFVLWEGTREISCCGCECCCEPGPWVWTNTTITYYPATSNVWYYPE